MIVWLASYPRSGNTLLRSRLLKCFGLNTYSLYDDTTDIGARPELSSVVGHVSHGLNKRKFYREAAASKNTYFVKTHDLPWDDGKAIYVVRDGRSSVVSYYHYNRNFFPGWAVSLRDVVLGDCMFGSWSDHIEAWAPKTRPKTLLLRYEDLVHDPRHAIEVVSDFIGHPVVSWDLPQFADFKAVDPKFFRAGDDTGNIGELAGDELDLFWLMHGELMMDMGYVDAPQGLDNAARAGAALRRELCEIRGRLDGDERVGRRSRRGKADVVSENYLPLIRSISRFWRRGDQ